MSELERSLLSVGTELQYPPTPDLAAAVRTRLAAGRPARRFVRPLAIAVAVLVAALVAVLAIPSARTAVLRFFHLRGVSIERVGTLPRVPAGADLALGDLVSLDRARRLVHFRIALPLLAGGTPRSIYVDQFEPPGGQVWLVFRSRAGVRVLLTEFQGRGFAPFVRKSAGPRTRVEPVRVDGGRGFFLSGAKHVVTVDAQGLTRDERIRLAGNVLLWERGPLTLRLEGPLNRGEALRIARAVR